MEHHCEQEDRGGKRAHGYRGDENPLSASRQKEKSESQQGELITGCVVRP